MLAHALAALPLPFDTAGASEVADVEVMELERVNASRIGLERAGLPTLGPSRELTAGGVRAEVRADGVKTPLAGLKLLRESWRGRMPSVIRSMPLRSILLSRNNPGNLVLLCGS